MLTSILELTDTEFASLTDFVKINYGLDLSAKKAFAQMRLQSLIAGSGFSTFTDYFEHAMQDRTGVAVSSMINSLTINYTLFYRESFHFDLFAADVLPQLVEKEHLSHDLRIWSAGCSTGEEPYTLAITVADFLGDSRALWDTKILATDISTFALKKALVGEYPVESIKDLRADWTKKYFVPHPTNSQSVLIAPSIKDEVIFRKHNLVKDPFTFKQKFHAIFCRNVMIYFDEETKQRLLKKLYDVLDEGGYLFIGMSETINHSQTKFHYIAPSVYRKAVSL